MNLRLTHIQATSLLRLLKNYANEESGDVAQIHYYDDDSTITWDSQADIPVDIHLEDEMQPTIRS
jgi:hypothetical protein